MIRTGLSAAGYDPAKELEIRVLRSSLIIHVLENTSIENMP